MKLKVTKARMIELAKVLALGAIAAFQLFLLRDDDFGLFELLGKFVALVIFAVCALECIERGVEFLRPGFWQRLWTE
jgi:hypothetical protein